MWSCLKELRGLLFAKHFGFGFSSRSFSFKPGQISKGTYTTQTFIQRSACSFAALQADCSAASRALVALALNRDAEFRDRSLLEQSLMDKDKLIASLRHQLATLGDRANTNIVEKGLQQKVSRITLSQCFFTYPARNCVSTRRYPSPKTLLSEATSN